MSTGGMSDSRLTEVHNQTLGNESMARSLQVDSTTERVGGSDHGAGGPDDDALTLAIMEALDETSDVIEDNVEFTLYDYLEPAALEELYAHAASRETPSWSFEFTVEDHVVRVRDDGTIAVE